MFLRENYDQHYVSSLVKKHNVSFYKERQPWNLNLSAIMEIVIRVYVNVL